MLTLACPEICIPKKARRGTRFTRGKDTKGKTGSLDLVPDLPGVRFGRSRLFTRFRARPRLWNLHSDEVECSEDEEDAPSDTIRFKVLGLKSAANALELGVDVRPRAGITRLSGFGTWKLALVGEDDEQRQRHRENGCDN